MKKPKTDIMKNEETAIGALAVPMDQLIADAALNTGTVRVDDVTRPFINIAQKMALHKHPGTKEGDIFEAGSDAIYDGKTGILFIPLFFDRAFIIWKTQAAGGGFVKSLGYREGSELLGQCKRNDLNRYILPDNPQHELSDTRIHIGLIAHPDGMLCGAIMSMKRSQIPVSQAWVKIMKTPLMHEGRMVQLPDFAFAYRITTELKEKNGATYMNWHVKRERPVTHEEYRHALTARSEVEEMMKAQNLDFSKDEAEPSDSV